MNSKHIMKGLFLITITGALLIPCETTIATDAAQEAKMPGAGIESVLSDYYTPDTALPIEKYLVPTEKSTYLDMAFANVEEGSYLYIRSAPNIESEWLGKLYKNYAAKIIGPVGEWTQIKSGNVTGYVKTEFIATGVQAEAVATELIAQTAGPNTDVQFTYAQSREEEEAEAEKVAAEKVAEEAAAEKEKAEEVAATIATGSGQAVVDYACQFIGNPYVWGGTDLTNGADCSGFIQSVYKNFGVNMPRTSGEMRNAGTAVSYDQAEPGDVICYNGHVGIYIGDGKVVNAIDEAHGIGISNAMMMNIITVRRML